MGILGKWFARISLQGKREVDAPGADAAKFMIVVDESMRICGQYLSGKKRSQVIAECEEHFRRHPMRLAELMQACNGAIVRPPRSADSTVAPVGINEQTSAPTVDQDYYEELVRIHRILCREGLL